jgi:hypothetical protein
MDHRIDLNALSPNTVIHVKHECIFSLLTVVDVSKGCFVTDGRAAHGLVGNPGQRLPTSAERGG